MRRGVSIALFVLVGVVGLVLTGTQGSAQEAKPAAALVPGGSMPGNQLVVYADNAVFWGPSNPENCALRSRYKHGEPVGFRADAIDFKGNRIAQESELIVHLSYAGRTEDLKMRFRATANQPERQFWVAKWVVPMDAAPGIVRYSVTAKDKLGRTGEFRPYEVDASQLTIVE